MQVELVPYSEFKRVKDFEMSKYEKLQLISDMCRINILTSIMVAGSGHLGTCFSSIDIMVLLYYFIMGEDDIFMSSKGHDAPAQYSVLHSIGVLRTDDLLKLRRAGGLPGHPENTTPGVVANSGSLGMGISKAKGLALGCKGTVFVLLGDGELQEGQFYESINNCAKQGISNIVVIVDNNVFQSERKIDEISRVLDNHSLFGLFDWDCWCCM